METAMIDRGSVIKGLLCIKGDYIPCASCKYADADGYGRGDRCKRQCASDAIVMLKEQDKEIKALRLLVEWAEECDFGFDQFPDEYERYKDEIKDMKYIDGMIHVAKRTLEDHGAFEEGR